MITSDQAINMWNEVPSEERIKVIRLIGDTMTHISMRETGEPSNEYGAYYCAYYLLWAVLSKEEYDKHAIL